MRNETIPSKIKLLYLELPEYQFIHSPAEELSGRNLFVGRRYVRERLKTLLLHSGACPSGAYLVTGYRGMGKTSVVEQTIREINDPKQVYLHMDLALSQEDVKEEDVLRSLSRMLRRNWESLKNKSDWKAFVKTAGYKDIQEQLVTLCENLYDSVRKNTSNEFGTRENLPDNSTRIKDLDLRGRQVIRSMATSKEIEKELIYILDNIHAIRKNNPGLNIPYFIFIIDELDKIEPNYFFNPEYNEKYETPRERNTNIFGINKYRKRQEVIARLLANLKSFLNTAKAKFIFIGGREMYDAALADIADRDSFYSSIFHDIIYVNSFFKDSNNARSGLTDLTETYLCKLLITPSFLKQHTEKSPDDDTSYNLSTMFEYLLYTIKQQKDQMNLNSDRREKEIQEVIYKTIFFLQNFIIFLTYRSNGTPKKLVSLIESFVRAYDQNEIDKLRRQEIVICSTENTDKKKKRLFLQFTYNQQYEIGLTSNLYRPYVIIHSRYLKSLGDKLLYSTAFIMDFMLKFHPHAFSWRNIEMIPEIILVNKDPNLRYFMEDVLKFLSGMYIRETVNGIFQYKYFNKQANEIKLLTKTAEPASAAFNFTLDESLHVKRYYRLRLAELQKNHPNFHSEYIHSIGFVQGVLGDLHYFDKEYDEAIIYYTDAAQVLRQRVQYEPEKVTKHQAVLYIRNKLLLGLCLEKIKAHDSAYSIYRGLILNMPKLLDKVSHLDAAATHDERSEASLTEFWDKPIRRMQLFIKPNIALLDLIEKQRMDGITYANLSRNYSEIHQFLTQRVLDSKTDVEIGKVVFNTKIKSDRVRVQTLLADYYNNVGSLLFYKNRNFSELYKVLKHHGLTSEQSGKFRKFQKIMGGAAHYNPSVSAFLYYYISLENQVQSYQHKLKALKDIKIEGGVDYKLLLSSDNFMAKALALLLPECEGNINTTGLYMLGNLFSKIGDTLLSSLTKEKIEKDRLDPAILDLYGSEINNEINKPDKDILNRLIRRIQDANNIETLCDINYVLLIYRAAGFFYLKASRTYSYGFQFKKFLFVLKDYVNSFAKPAYLKDTKNLIEKTVINVAVKIFYANTWISDVANRPQILKYREVLKFTKNRQDWEATPHIYLNITSSPEIRETIVLVEEIKLKMNNKLGIFDTSPISLVSPYDLVSNKYTRIHELRYQCDLNYIKIKKLEAEVLLKSTVISDMHILGLLDKNSKKIYPVFRNALNAYIRKALKSQKAGQEIPEFTLPDFPELLQTESSPKNKIRNIEYVIRQRIINYLQKGESGLMTERDLKNYFPELYFPQNKNTLNKTKILICDSIFCLFEIVRTLNLYGITYISSHSFLANIHYKFANWCQAFINYEILIEEENQESSIQNLLKRTLGDEDIYYIEPNYHNELALQHFHAAIQTHNGGRAYRSINQTMSFLEDDFNDNLSHFSAAAERFRINTGLIRDKIQRLKEKIRYSSLYEYDNYLRFH